ncbi:MAG: peroxidase [Verrucomicrobiales bacterium]|jgi:peroxidase
MRFLSLSLVLSLVSLVSLHAEVRSLDGAGNNTKEERWGATGSQLQRIDSVYYGDGMSTMGGEDRPNPRMVSNVVADQSVLSESARGLSDMTWCWGQFLDHDITLVLPSEDEFVPVMVDEGDMMSPIIPVMRSQFDPKTGTSVENPRQQVNTTTAFIDASNVYGNSTERAEALREHAGGRLLSRGGKRLPLNLPEIEMENPNALPISELLMAGDVRANENPALISMHTLWMREHNRWADVLGGENPTWTDEEIYQQARRMVMGEIQSITFQEFLPALLGPHAPSLDETHYDSEMNPGMFNEISGALYRIGHTMVSAHIMQMNDDGSVPMSGSFLFKEAFFQPELMNDPLLVDRVLKGVASKRMQEIDPFVVEDLRNFLFAEPGQGGLDLIAINLQRGRDHGLPSFNQARAALGLAPHASFENVSSNSVVSQGLAEAYGDIDLMDLWIGAVSEDHLPGASVGETIATALAMQFRHLRDGDRFFFLMDDALSDEEKAAIRATKLSDVIMRNTTMRSLQETVFIAPPKDTWMDLDHDGVADLREVIAGTNPADVSSALQMLTLELAGDTVELHWTSVVGKSYLIQHSDSLKSTWVPMETLTAASDHSSVRVSKFESGRGFYRVVVSR